ncbi:MAG: hypothetical protein H6600_10095 [Flavobacteriales bacterium]|nr:hypothetical protein [Flavobacteriales bacterium]
MEEIKKFKTMAEIESRLALYKRSVHFVKAITCEELANVLYEQWDQYKGLMLKYVPVDLSKKLATKIVRSEDHPNPRGDAYEQYSVTHYFELIEGDFQLMMNHTLQYGFDKNLISCSFNFNYIHGGEHQFGISVRKGNVPTTIDQLELRSMDHTAQELEQLGEVIVKICSDRP